MGGKGSGVKRPDTKEDRATITLHVTREKYRELVSAAHRGDTTISQLVRDALDVVLSRAAR